MKLKEGKMTMRELSIWFGKENNPDYLSKCSKSAKEKKLKTLSAYADFHFEGKKLYIDKVRIEEFTPALEIIEEEMPKRWGVIKDKNGNINETLQKERIDTSSRVGTDIWYNVPTVQASLTLSTTKSYTNRVKVEKYGHNYLNDKGTHGISEYVWMNEDGSAPLDKKQMEIVNQCANEAYNGLDLLIASIDDDYRLGLISKEERNKAVGDIETEDKYSIFIDLLINRLGFKPDKRTRLIDTISFED